MIRRSFVWLHRWFGLGMALFLIIEGLTGCLLAFKPELTRLLNPKLFVSRPSPDAKPLDLATLVEKAESVGPSVRVAYFARYCDDQVLCAALDAKPPRPAASATLVLCTWFSTPTAAGSLGDFYGVVTTLEEAFSRM